MRSYGHLGDNIYSVLYDGVNENGLQSIIYLNVWSTVGRTLWEGLVVALLKEVSHCKYTWRIQNPVTVPVSILSSSLPHALSYYSDSMPACLLPCSLSWWSWTNTLWNCEPQIECLHLYFALVMVFCNSNRKVSKAAPLLPAFYRYSKLNT